MLIRVTHRAERWSEAQQTSATPAAIERAIAQAQASGTLNLTSRGLVEELCAWNAKGQSDKWWEVVQLAKLDLSHNELRHLPEELFEALDSLQTLHVGNNGLSELPSSLQRCKILARINLQHNAFQRLPSFIGALEGLVHVNLDHNALTRLPDALCDLVLVETLTCPFNQLAALPERLGRMRALTKLDASSNALAALPASIGDLASLSELEVGHNRLSALPEAMARLGALVRLDCRENALSGAGGIPASPRLAELLLGFNRLQMLPRGLPPSLSVLDVRDNLLVEVDEVELLPLVRLKTLDLRNNELSRLPPRLGLMTSLSALLLEGNPLFILCLLIEGNPLKAVRRAIVTAPAREILEYLRSRIEEPSSSAQQPAGSQQHRNAPLGAPPSSRDSSSSHDTHDARGGCGGFGGQDVASAVRLSSTTGKLLLRSRNLRELPPDAGRVADVPLHTLDLADNLLESLAGCGRLGGVTHLDASNNQLAAAGDALGRDLAPLRALASLKMRHNFLPRFPRFVASLNALTELDLSQNRIADFPVGVCGALPRLHTLLVCYNRLESLAPDVDGLRSLTHLDASNNQLVIFPFSRPETLVFDPSSFILHPSSLPLAP
ncbi:hypothetical protein T484DRAFT_1823813 [Baffinella frigidus]|nr:hypothetical protein T484DRAFT_1823813 [Cryptophyta sp. CCMP2293]